MKNNTQTSLMVLKDSADYSPHLLTPVLDVQNKLNQMEKHTRVSRSQQAEALLVRK
jgi:hypothetical protein